MKKAVIIIVCYFISIFISNFVVARELNVRWFDGMIPGGNIAHGTLTCESSQTETALEKDRTEILMMLYGVMMAQQFLQLI